ncbi:hypothetical protein [Rubrivirga sp.]|uniref:hypothetical protein n=1 Tax=Rubrivirga sp. TaxID=1885344 RepID=UPI003C771391
MPESTARRRINWGVLGVEAGAIFLSVLLGFGVAEWRDARDRDQRHADILDAFALEVADTRDDLVRGGIYHHWLAREVEAGIEDGSVVRFRDAFRIEGMNGFNSLRLERAAWETATATGDVALLGFETASALWRLYNAQAVIDAEQTRLRAIALETIGTAEGAPASQFVPLLQEFNSLERDLLRLSNAALEAVADERGVAPPEPIEADVFERNPFAETSDTR